MQDCGGSGIFQCAISEHRILMIHMRTLGCKWMLLPTEPAITWDIEIDYPIVR